MVLGSSQVGVTYIAAYPEFKQLRNKNHSLIECWNKYWIRQYPLMIPFYQLIESFMVKLIKPISRAKQKRQPQTTPTKIWLLQR